MNEPIYMDAEYESIRAIMENRGGNGDQLPGKTVTFIPSDRADAVMALDKRIQTLQKYAPFIISGAVALVSFLVGRAL